MDAEESATAGEVTLEGRTLGRFGQDVATGVHENECVVAVEVAGESLGVIGGVDSESVRGPELFDCGDRIGNRQVDETDRTMEHEDPQPRSIDRHRAHRSRALASFLARVSSTRCGCSL